MSKIKLQDIPNDICITIFLIIIATSCYYLSYHFFDIFMNSPAIQLKKFSRLSRVKPIKLFTLIIHGSRLVQIRGTVGEDVVFHLESHCNEEDVLRSARPKGKRCRQYK